MATEISARVGTVVTGQTRRPVWWRELAVVVVFYWLYAQVRDAHGRSGGEIVALRHGHDVEHLEQWLHLDFEQPVQNGFLHAHWLLQIMGGFYGTAHFVLTVGVLGWLLWRRPEAYRQWRRILGLTTIAAVALFALYPTAPPRLTGRTQDTLATVGGLWSYNSGVLEHISDPYAAMPSLHLGWSCWTAAALAGTVGANWPLRRRWLFALYPAVVTLVVVATGTHWFLDTVAGAALLVVVWYAERSARRAWMSRRPVAAATGAHVVAAPSASTPDDALVD